MQWQAMCLSCTICARQPIFAKKFATLHSHYRVQAHMLEPWSFARLEASGGDLGAPSEILTWASSADYGTILRQSPKNRAASATVWCSVSFLIPFPFVTAQQPKGLLKSADRRSGDHNGASWC